MKLQGIRLSNFQSFGSEPTELYFDGLTFLIGPNGSGKTAAMQALCRLFAFDPALRRLQASDFNVPDDEEEVPGERSLWLEADFLFPELLDDGRDHPTIPTHFSHMRIDETGDSPRIRFRLEATLGIDSDIDSQLSYVLDLNEDGTSQKMIPMPRGDRSYIQVHYLPARRDPAEHIAFSANALLGRLLRAVNWEAEREIIRDLTAQISDSLAGNISVAKLSEKLAGAWKGLHKGTYFADPSVSFMKSEIEALLRHLSVSFSPSHDENLVDFSRLSDGQKSMLYLSLVLTSQAIGRSVLAGGDDTFDPLKLRPAVFTIVAVEEPENSLSPHYLGRIVSSLNELVKGDDAQAIIATHAPSMLRRVDPGSIRYLRLNEARQTQITHIKMPPTTDEAHKFVREAIQAFPELYFSRLVVLGEGDSEEIVLPRLFAAKGSPVDECAISVVPLGGRHVNHFWRLLYALGIPFITLLDMDLARHQGGWGRVKYVNDQLGKYATGMLLPPDYGIQRWNDDDHQLLNYPSYINELEGRDVFFSSPMDLDFALLQSYPAAYEIKEADRVAPEESKVKAVLGDSYHGVEQYNEEEQKLFVTYHKLFKLGSKPAGHINAFSKLTDEDILTAMPASLDRLVDAAIKKLETLPE